MATEHFQKAANTRLFFMGNRTIDEIAQTDRGLLDLDRLRGNSTATWLKEALGTYLDDPVIAGELDRMVKRSH